MEVSQLGFIRSESIGSLPLTVILAIIHSETEDNHGFAVRDDSLPIATHVLDRHSIGNSQSPAPTKDIPETHLHNRIQDGPQEGGDGVRAWGLEFCWSEGRPPTARATRVRRGMPEAHGRTAGRMTHAGPRKLAELQYTMAIVGGYSLG